MIKNSSIKNIAACLVLFICQCGSSGNEPVNSPDTSVSSDDTLADDTSTESPSSDTQTESMGTDSGNSGADASNSDADIGSSETETDTEIDSEVDADSGTDSATSSDSGSSDTEAAEGVEENTSSATETENSDQTESSTDTNAQTCELFNDDGSISDEAFTYYRDDDTDGVGGNFSVITCESSPPEGYVTVSGDCDDDNALLTEECIDLGPIYNSAQAEVDSPCISGTGASRLPMLFTSSFYGWASCANSSAPSGERGVFRTFDGGTTWERVDHSIACGSDGSSCDLKDMTVYDIEQDSGGNIYLCGLLESTSDTTLVVKYSTTTQSYSELAGTHQFSSGAPSQCGDIALSSTGVRLVFSSRTNNHLYTSNNSGSSWTAQSGWDDDTIFDYSTYRVEFESGYFYAAGTTSIFPPYFFTPRDGGSFYQLAKNTVDAGVVADIYAMTALDGGNSWIVGYNLNNYALAGNASASSGMSLSTDGGVTWNDVSVTIDRGDGNSYFMGTVYDIDCNDSQSLCLAVGVFYDADSLYSIGGIILYSEDGGESWKNLMHDDFEVGGVQPAYQGITFINQRFYILGDNTLIIGSFEE